MKNIDSSKQKIFFGADFHAYHSNICLGTTKWPDKESCRNFNTIEEMNQSIIKSINSVVGKNDILISGGDWSLGGWENIWHFRKQIVCENIIHVNGNHDEHIEKNKFFNFLEKQGDVIYEISDPSKYRVEGDNPDMNVYAQDIFTEVHDLLYLKIDKTYVVVSHEPFEIWRNKNIGAIHIHGHVHHGLDNSELNTKFKRVDVGWKGELYEWNEILKTCSNRMNGFHHER